MRQHELDAENIAFSSESLGHPSLFTFLLPVSLKGHNHLPRQLSKAFLCFADSVKATLASVVVSSAWHGMHVWSRKCSPRTAEPPGLASKVQWKQYIWICASEIAVPVNVGTESPDKGECCNLNIYIIKKWEIICSRHKLAPLRQIY